MIDSRGVSKVAQYTVLIIIVGIMAFPMYFALISSIKDTGEIMFTPLRLPAKMLFSNYTRALVVGNMAVSFLNSLFVTSMTIVTTGLLGTMTAYLLVRVKFSGAKVLMSFFLAGLMIPVQLVLIPLSFNFSFFHLNDSFTVLILLFTAFSLSFTIFLTGSFLRSIPVELEEAAFMDGCGRTRTFFEIIFPISAPGLVTAGVFNFLGAWNNLIFPLLFVRKKSMQVIALGLQSFFAERVSDYGGVMAAIIISMIPPIVCYILSQEKIEKGMIAGAVKG